MINKRRLWIIAGLLVVVVVILVLFLPNQNDILSFKTKVDQLPAGKTIFVSAWPEWQGVQKGDSFYYILEVVYDRNQISGIDREILDENVNFNPFEIKSIDERQFSLDSETRVYQRLYEIQLVTGDVERFYEFPSIVVLYKLKSEDGYAETSVKPESVYVAPLLPSNGAIIINGLKTGEYSLQPMEGTIKKIGINNISLILWIIGGLLLVITVIDLNRRVIPQWKTTSKQKRSQRMGEVLGHAYRNLRENFANDTPPKSIFHQADYILRVLLSPKEQIGWLEEPDFDTVPDEVKPLVISSFEKCQQSYGSEDINKKDVEELLAQLDEIVNFYFSEDVGVWKS